MPDTVNHPSHYSEPGKIECIDALKDAMTKEEFIGFCKGNVMKYLWRCNKKNGTADLKKAQWYLNKLVEVTDE